MTTSIDPILRRRPRIVSDELMLTPGPGEIAEPFFTYQMTEIVEHPIDRVTAIFDQLFERPKPEALGWRFETGDQWVNIEFSAIESWESDLAFETSGPSIWGGSPLTMNCSPTVLLSVWSQIRSNLSGVWLADSDSFVYRPESFLDVWSKRETRILGRDF